MITTKQWVTYRISYAVRHNDAGGREGEGGGGVIANDILKMRKSYRISKFLNCPLLKN